MEFHRATYTGDIDWVEAVFPGQRRGNSIIDQRNYIEFTKDVNRKLQLNAGAWTPDAPIDLVKTQCGHKEVRQLVAESNATAEVVGFGIVDGINRHHQVAVRQEIHDWTRQEWSGRSRWNVRCGLGLGTQNRGAGEQANQDFFHGYFGFVSYGQEVCYKPAFQG